MLVSIFFSQNIFSFNHKKISTNKHFLFFSCQFSLGSSNLLFLELIPEEEIGYGIHFYSGKITTTKGTVCTLADCDQYDNYICLKLHTQGFRTVKVLQNKKIR